MTSSLHQGMEIENKAEALLRQWGWTFLAKGFRRRMGEIDLIFEQTLPNQVPIELVFIEIRMRTRGGLITGSESVGPTKQRRLKLAASVFLIHYRGQAQSIRFDVLSWDGVNWEHLPNAFWDF